MKIVGVSTLVLLLMMVIGIFWQQELKYLNPTPVPENYHPITINQPLDLSSFGISAQKKPVLLHFFNADCPCSRFNIDHLQSLVENYGDQVDFYAVIQGGEHREEAIQTFRNNYTFAINVISDEHEKIAEACGVYATPQAVLIDTTHHLYYRGNYNVSRYCTAPGTSFAEIAIKSVLQGAPPPQFLELATTAYGCELPSNQKNFLTNLF